MGWLTLLVAIGRDNGFKKFVEGRFDLVPRPICWTWTGVGLILEIRCRNLHER
jgi:hypothetical protein